VSLPRPRPGIALHTLPDGSHALTDTDGGRMLVVNGVGAAIWLLLGEGQSLEEITAHVVEALGVDAERARVDATAFVSELGARGFLR
jgi:hypothetical protein